MRELIEAVIGEREFNWWIGMYLDDGERVADIFYYKRTKEEVQSGNPRLMLL